MKFNHKVITSTTAIFGERFRQVGAFAHTDSEDKFGELVADWASDMIESAVNDSGFSVDYVESYYPRDYANETDSILIDISYNSSWKRSVFGCIKRDKDSFVKYIADNSNTLSGLDRFVPNTWNDWLDGWDFDDWRCVSVAIRFIVMQKTSYYAISHSWDEFVCNAIEELY